MRITVLLIVLASLAILSGCGPSESERKAEERRFEQQKGQDRAGWASADGEQLKSEQRVQGDLKP